MIIAAYSTVSNTKSPHICLVVTSASNSNSDR